MSFFGSSFEQTLAPTSQQRITHPTAPASAPTLDPARIIQPLFLLLRDDMRTQFQRLQGTVEATCTKMENHLMQTILGESSFRQEQLSEIVGATNAINAAVERFTQQFRDISAQLKGLEGQLQLLSAEIEAVEGRLDESLKEKIGEIHSELKTLHIYGNDAEVCASKSGNEDTKVTGRATQNVISYEQFARHLSDLGAQVTTTQPFLVASSLSTQSNSDLI